MQRALRSVVARLYALTVRAPGSEEEVEVAPDLTVPRFVLEWSEAAPEGARRLLARFPDLELADRSILVVGRGAADVAIEVAQQRARMTTALDIATRRLALSERRLARHPTPGPVELKPFRGSLADLGGQCFDVILAVDAFPRFGAPRSSRYLEDFVEDLARHLRTGGLLALRFGPPWKSPFGGGIDSRLPWAHLIFPESIVFDAFRRARRNSTARAFEDIGVNRITVARLLRALRSTQLECVHLERNVGSGRGAAALRVPTRLAPIHEYVTYNLYGVWRRP